MEEEKQLVIRRTFSVSLPNSLEQESKKREGDNSNKGKYIDPNIVKKHAAIQREQEFKTLQLKHKHKCELDAFSKLLRQKDEEIENLKKQLSTQEEQNLAYRDELEKQSKVWKDNELEFENRLTQLKTNLENIHLQELEEKVTRVRKEEQSAAKMQIEDLKDQIEVTKRKQKNERIRNEEDYQVTLLQLQVKDLQTQISELKKTESGEKGAKENLIKMNKALMEKVNSNTKKMKDVDGTMKQVVKSKMQFVEKSTAEIARLHQELSVSRSELKRVKSELVSAQHQASVQAAQALRISIPRAKSFEKKSSTSGRRSPIADPAAHQKKISRTRSSTSPRSEHPTLEKKSSRSGMKASRSEQLQKKQVKAGMKTAKSDQLKHQKDRRTSIGSVDTWFEKKQSRAARKIPWSPKFLRTEKLPDYNEKRVRRKSTGSALVQSGKQPKVRNQNSGHRLSEKNISKSDKKIPRTEHVSIKKQRKNGTRSKSPKTEHIDKKHLRKRSSVEKTTTFDQPRKLQKARSIELKQNKDPPPSGYQQTVTDELMPFAISRSFRSSSEKRSKSFRRNKSHSLLPRMKEREKRRRSSRPV